jgi:alkylation response protein AidB-like acyl-CoA dehydrogenase
MTFRAPTRDILFSLTEAAGFDALPNTAAFAEVDLETVEAVLEGAASLTNEVLAPLNRAGDTVGARFENGQVIAAPGFADAYRSYREGGWTSLAAAPEHGGQGLPKAVSLAVFEMVHAANMAFGLCPMLSEAAIEALTAHGTERQKRLYLPKLVSGEWTGTMNLTEPQAGSDLALLHSRAEPDGEGGYRLTGQKIYITWGDHDVAENICHLVLARLPGAPDGVKGISLFLAPKRLVGEDGALGVANALRPASIEHKLGIHGSPTCVMLFEGAKAELVGQENQGLAHMFTMMNAARLNVGMEGVGIAERAYQQALAYALDRRQGRSPWSEDKTAAIFDHPDVRRTLTLMKAKIEAARGVCLSCAVAADLAKHADTAEARAAASLREELLTPIAKGWSTDVGVEVASMGVQVHGGMGFIEETGAAQHYRDARIAPIYEGTNGIQAMDLAGRKLSMAGGAAVKALLADIRATAEAMTDARLSGVAARLAAAADAAERAGDWLMAHKGSADALAGATAYLQLMGEATGGWMLAKGAKAAAARLEEGSDDPFYVGKIAMARVYGDQVLSRAPGLAEAVTGGADDLHALTAAALGA